jgi:hypothetical protein
MSATRNLVPSKPSPLIFFAPPSGPFLEREWRIREHAKTTSAGQRKRQNVGRLRTRKTSRPS